MNAQYHCAGQPFLWRCLPCVRIEDPFLIGNVGLACFKLLLQTELFSRGVMMNYKEVLEQFECALGLRRCIYPCPSANDETHVGKDMCVPSIKMYVVALPMEW